MAEISYLTVGCCRWLGRRDHQLRLTLTRRKQTISEHERLVGGAATRSEQIADPALRAELYAGDCGNSAANCAIAAAAFAGRVETEINLKGGDT